MRKVFSFLLPVVLILCLAPGSARADERILSFHSMVDVGRDGGLVVTETITVRAEGSKIKRGIYRDFPTSYEADWGLRLKVGFKVLGAMRDGEREAWRTKRLDNGVRVYLGRSGQAVSRGEHTYVLRYATSCQLGYFDGYDELAWNVTGTDWAFPIDQASAYVRLPRKARVLGADAFTGPRGARGRSFRVQSPAPGSDTDYTPGTALFITTAPLAPREGLTVVVRFDKGVVAPPEAPYTRLWRDNRWTFLGLGGVLLVVLAYLGAWIKVGRDPSRGAIAPLFHPPDGLSPAACRYILNMGFDDKAMACALVGMAVKGMVAIKEEGKTYRVNWTPGDRPASDVLTKGELALVSELFGDGRGGIVLKQANHRRIRAGRRALQDALKRHYKAMYFSLNTLWMLPGAVLSGLCLLALAQAGTDPKEAGFLMVWLAVWSLGTGLLLRRAVRARKIGLFLFSLPFVGGWFMGAGMLVFVAGPLAGAAIVALGGLAGLFGYLLKAPTPHGRRVMDQLEGFRLFLGVSEKDRLNLINPPERTPELFEAYLPYAMALDVEQQWGEQFAGVLAAAGADPSRTAYRPGWYGGGAFSGSDLGGALGGLGGSLSGAVASSSTAPGSSSGGGGSGGGGGGGGGGGW